MSRDNPRPRLPGHGRMENYTGPFLVTAGVVLFMALLVIWGLYGLPGAFIAALLADRIIHR